MSEGFQVILEDLQSTYLALHKEAQALHRQKTNAHCPVPDCGGSGVNASLRDALDVVGTLYDLLIDTVESHAMKMKQAHDNYTRNDDDVLNLFNTLEG